MSLLIKGMDMPKLDENAEHLWVPGWIEVGKDGKAIFCTGTHFDPNTIRSYAIEEDPTHGRLIDADKLYEAIEQMEGLGTIDYENDVALSAVEVLNAIDEAPTIIEADE